jgi:hypothetical protein
MVFKLVKGMRFGADPRDQERMLFDKADLMAIVTSPVYFEGKRPVGGGCEAASRFLLIGLLSGIWPDEIAQLRICDLRQDEETGRWYFDVGRTGGRSTKILFNSR